MRCATASCGVLGCVGVVGLAWCAGDVEDLAALLANLRDTIRRRLAGERGTLYRDAPNRIALLDPSPYHIEMSSLGDQVIYRELNARTDTVAERVFAPDDVAAAYRTREPVLTDEFGRPLVDYPIVAVSLAYENELGSFLQTLRLACIPPRREERVPGRHPFVRMGGPMTFSNPVPFADFADAVVIGEADELIHLVLDTLLAHGERDAQRKTLVDMAHVWVPSLYGETLPTVAVAKHETKVPAYAPITTAETELADMFLVETERGCSRSCTYCVMRWSSSAGMRLAPMEKIFARGPDDARKVGLVGAAVRDHPRIVEIVHGFVDKGMGVGLSSLRPDRLTGRFGATRKRSGYRTLTTVMDGPSERLRGSLERHAKVRHWERAAELARVHGMQTT